MTAAGTRTDAAGILDRAIDALNAGGGELPFDDVDRALSVASGDPRLWHVKGLMHRRQDRRELAIPALKRATELAPHEALIAQGYAHTLLEAGLPAVEPYARAVKLAPNKPEVVKGMISALVAERRVGEAIVGLETVLQRSPTWADGHELLASLRWTEGEREGFARSYDAALRQHPGAADLRREQLAALLDAEQWDEALDRIEQGRRAVGEQALFGMYDAIIQAELGHSEIAERLFAPFEGIEDGPFQVRRVRHLLRSGRIEQAAALIEQWRGRPEAYMFWPYASIAWRMIDEDRWNWLEGDPSFVGIYDLSDHLPPLDELAATLRKLHTLSGQPLHQSLRGGTQTDGNLFHRIDPVLVKLREAIRAAVAEHVQRLPAHDLAHPLLSPSRDRIEFAGAWSVRLRQGGYHANHVHPMGWISSALYIVLPPDLGREDAGILTLGEARAPTFPIDLPPFRTVEPKPGRLALFPSYSWHGTRPFVEGERITVAFDVARLA